MSLYWIVHTTIPVDKVISLSKYLSQFVWYAGMRIDDDNFPEGLATIRFRVKDSIAEHLSDLTQHLTSIELYHTPENEDTWKPAHWNARKGRKTKPFNTLHKNGVLILGKDSGEYLIELLKIKKFLVGKGYKNASLLKLQRDIPNQSLSQKLRLWGLLCRFSIIVDRIPSGHLSELRC
jgi:hypothetical protein